MLEGRRLIRFRGALYAQACGLGDGCAVITPDDVGAVLADQYFNKGKTTAERLRDKWVQSDLFVLTEIYPSMLSIGVAPGKTGETFSEGLPLIVDEDALGIAERWLGAAPKYLVLDGQNRVVKLRRTSPRKKHQAYVGNKIWRDVVATTAAMEGEVEEAEDALRDYASIPTPGALSRLQYFFDRGLVTTDEFPEAERRAAETLVYNGSLYRCVEVGR